MIALVAMTALASADGLCGVPCNGLADDSVRVARRHNFRHPRCCASDGLSSKWMQRATARNASLLRYFYPHDPVRAWTSSSLGRAFRPITRGCRIVADACYCIHVTGLP